MSKNWLTCVGWDRLASCTFEFKGLRNDEQDAVYGLRANTLKIDPCEH